MESKNSNTILLRNLPIQQPKRDKKDLPKPVDVQGWAQQAMLDHDWLEAARRWAVLRSAYPHIPPHWIQGGVALMKAGEYTKAEDLLNLAKEKFKSSPSPLLTLSEMAILQQDLGVAEQYLKEARELFPDSCATWLKSAELEIKKGEIEKAKEYTESAKIRWAIVSDRFLRVVEDFNASINTGVSAEHSENLLANTKTKAHAFRPFGLKHLTELIWTKTLFNLRSEAHHNYLSYLWWVIEPMLHMLVYYIVFSFLLQRGGENFTVFLLTGLIPWLWFSKSVSSSSNVIVDGQTLMLQTGVPAIYFPLVKLLQTTIKQIPVFLLLFIFTWSQGYAPSLHWLVLIPLVVIQLFITTTFVLGISAIVPFIRDLHYLVPSVIAFMFFLSGIFYDYKNISPEWQGLFLKNPMAYLLKCYREILMEHTTPNLLTLSIWGLISGSMCIVLLLSYRRLQHVFPRVVME